MQTIRKEIRFEITGMEVQNILGMPNMKETNRAKTLFRPVIDSKEGEILLKWRILKPLPNHEYICRYRLCTKEDGCSALHYVEENDSEHGFVQEQAALHRVLDEIQEDVTFLAWGVITDDITDLHRQYLSAFYEEEFDKPESPLESTQKRPMVARKKVRAYIARMEAVAFDQSTGVELLRTLHKAYSGFVHGASPAIMDMYGGVPPRFHVQGMLGTVRITELRDDLWNYFYRGIVAFGLAIKAFGEDAVFASITKFLDEFEKESGENYVLPKGRKT